MRDNRWIDTLLRAGTLAALIVLIVMLDSFLQEYLLLENTQACREELFLQRGHR